MAAAASAEVVTTRFTKIGTILMAAGASMGSRYDSIHQNPGIRVHLQLRSRIIPASEIEKLLLVDQSSTAGWCQCGLRIAGSLVAIRCHTTAIYKDPHITGKSTCDCNEVPGVL